MQYFMIRGNPSADIIHRIAVKFIANLPKEEFAEDRIGFHFERAYFYYLDTQGLENLNDRRAKSQQTNWLFGELLKILPCTQLSKMTPNLIDQLVQDAYHRVPVHGLIIMNMEQSKVVLVGSMDKLGFPKGKIREDQLPHQCAYRQAHEQIGLKAKIDQNNYVQVEVCTKKNTTKICRFYICKADQSAIVARETKPTKEKQKGHRQILHSFSQIKSIGWYSLAVELPKLVQQSLINSPSRLAYLELNKRNAKKLLYREKKKVVNPLAQFQGFDNKKLAPIFLK